MSFNPKAVTFDCANTLIEVRWRPRRSIEACAQRVVLRVTDQMCADFASMFYEARAKYEHASLTRDPRCLRTFWTDLHFAWLDKWELPTDHAEALVAAGEELTYGPAQEWFRPFADAERCLARLRDSGIRIAVISNWDSSLHRILQTVGLASNFELIVASLEEGVEKPDRRLFDIALSRLGLSAEEVVHVGDDPVDDIEGARAAGIRSLLLDRTAGEVRPGIVRGLDELPEAFAWSV